MYNAILDKYIKSLKLGKNGFAFIQGEVPKKIKDPGLFTLPCRLGDSKPFDILADLGSCVNLIPLYIFKKPKIRLLEETDHVFGLVDGTKSNLVGIVKNLEVHIEKIKLLEDFYVMDMEKDPATPLLVGRRFLATASTIIYCKKDKIAVEGVTSTDGIGAQPPYYAKKDYMDYHFPGDWEIASDAKHNPFKDVLVFRKMHLEDIWRKYTSLGLNFEKNMTRWQMDTNEGLKNLSQMVETASENVVTSSEAHRNGVKRISDGVILNGDSPVPTRVIESVVQPVAPTTAEERLARKNKLKARGTLLMALPDKHQLKFNIHKDAKTLIEAIKKQFGGNKETNKEDINLKFLRSPPTEWRTHALIWRNKTDLEEQSLDDFTTEPVSAVASVSAASTKISVSALPNVDTMSNVVIYSFFASQSNSPQLDNDDLKQIDADDLEEMDLKWQMDMLTEGHFARKCRSPKDTRRNVAVEPQKRNVPVEISTSNALVSQYNGLESVEARLLVYQQNKSVFEEDIKLLKLEVQLRDNALVVLRQKFKKVKQERDDLKLKLEKIQTSSKNLSQLLASQTNDKTGLGYNTHIFTSSMFDCDEMFTSETDESFPASPIYDRYHSGDGYHDVPPSYTGKFMPPKPDLVFHDAPNVNETDHTAFNIELSPIKPEKDLSHTHRPSAPIIKDLTIENYIPATNHKAAIPKLQTYGNYRNRKACFVSVLTKSKLVAITAARPVTAAVPTPHGNPQHALEDKGVIDSGCSRTGKLDFDDVYFVKELKFNLFSVSQMCDKKNSVLFIDTEYIFLSPELKLPDENHVLLRVPKENNMYNVDIKNIVPSRDLTFLFTKATLDESNLCHRRLGYINFKTMNKLVKGNLVRGLPSKVFENNYTCVACKKGKQHKASFVTNDYSRFTWVFFLATKDETIPILKTFITGIKNQLSLKVKIIRSDNGTELKNHDLNQFCGMKGIKMEFSVPRTPQQNGIAERKNMTLIENRVLVIKPQNKTPYELLLGRTPSIGFMSPFDCPVTILNTLDPLGSGPTWLFDIDTLTKTMNYQPVTADNDDAFRVKEPKFEGRKPEFKVYVSISSNAQTKKHDDKTKKEAKGKSHIELSTGYRNFSAEFDDFFDNSINEDNAADFLVPAVGQISTNSTNTFSIAGPSNTAVSPTHVKSSYVNTSQYPDDPNMPKLEDITYSDDEEDVGAKADFTNLETTITVSHIPTTRVHKDHPVTQIISDLSSATQTRSMTRVVKDQGGLTQINNEDLCTCMFACFLLQKEPKREEVYVYQPPRFKDPDYPKRVYKVVKEPYGLHQALRAWYETLANYLLENGFQMGKIDHTLFIKRQKGDILLVQIYVDDIIFGFTNKDLCKAFEKLMKDKFQMSLIDGKSTSTPIYIEKPLLKDPNGEDVDVYTYRSMISSLMYLTTLRLYIMFTVCACAHFQVTPKASHLYAVKRIFRYLKGKPHLGLWYPKDSPFNLVAYSDSDYVGASLDRKSTTRGCQFLGCKLISWQCKKPTVVTTSSTEAEYVAAAIDEKVGIEVSAVDLKVSAIRLIVTAVSSKFLLFESIDCLPNEEIFTDLSRMGAKRTSWNEFSSSMASAVICLSTGRKFNLSKYIFDSLVRNVDSSTKFYMYPQFLQLMIRAQVGDLSSHSTKYAFVEGMIVAQQADDVADEGAADVDVDAIPAVEPSIPSPIPTTQLPPPLQELPSTSQVIPTPPPSLIVQPPSPQQQQPLQHLHDAKISIDLLHTLLETYTTLTKRFKHLEQDKIVQTLEITKLKQRVKKLERRNKLKVSKLRRLKRVGTTQRVDTSDVTVMDDVSKQGKIIATIDADKDVTLKDVDVVAKEVDVEKTVEIEENTDDDESDLAKLKEVVTTAKLMTEVVTAASATITATDTPITAATLTTAPSAARRRKGVCQMMKMMFILRLHRLLAREDLEVLWQLVKERFASSKPKNFLDDFLLTTLTYTFEKPDVQAQNYTDDLAGREKTSANKFVCNFSLTVPFFIMENMNPSSPTPSCEFLDPKKKLEVESWIKDSKNVDLLADSDRYYHRPLPKFAGVWKTIYEKDKLIYDKEEGTVLFKKDNKKIVFKMPHKMEMFKHIDFKDINTDCIQIFVVEGTVLFKKDNKKIMFKMPHKMEMFKHIDFKDINTDCIPNFVVEGEDDGHKKTHYSNSLNLGAEYKYHESMSEAIQEMFIDEHAPDYSFPPRFDVYPDDFLEIEDDDLSSPDNEDKVFNPGIIIHEKSVTIITRVAQEKKLAISSASLVFEDFDPPFYELLVFKDVPNSMRLLPFSSKSEEKVFKPGTYTSKKVHCCFLPELSHPGERKQENDKIGSKPNKNRKRGEAEKSQKQLQSMKEENLKKIQKEGPEMQNPTSFIRRKKKTRADLQFPQRYNSRGLFCQYLEDVTAKDLACNYYIYI
uniref:Integrase catalytic domain-containing protein n=1 Tax=Tanacetum cinerariifolium TaxID=118510 RepID=A0A6L2LFM3_TANCI|nr:hypothetical protein [Tanacetum cinerariifolium]